MKLTVVIPFHSGDAKLAIDLMFWIQELDELWDGKKLDYECVLEFPFMTEHATRSFKDYGQRLFKSCRLLIPSSPPVNAPWPKGANYMFHEALIAMREPFLWLEPDAIPLVPGWLDYINEEYFMKEKPFMGSINVSTETKRAHLSGVAVYPGNAHEYYKNIPSSVAFDMVDQSEILPQTHHTRLIKNFWGQTDLAPTFRTHFEKGDPINTLTLSAIPKESVLFHRNKDGTLLKLLRERKSETMTYGKI